MKYLILGEELSVEFSEIVSSLDNIEVIGILGEVVNKSALRAICEFDVHYVDRDYGDGLRCSHISNVGDWLVVSCYSYQDLFTKCDSLLDKSINLTQLSPDILQVVTLEDYLTSFERCNHSVVKVLTSRDVYDCLGLNKEDVRPVINSKIDVIDVEHSNNDVVYFDFINKNLVPSNRGIVGSGNPNYTHMCGLNTESFKCIDRRFLRSENTNIAKCLVNCTLDDEFTLSNKEFTNILIDTEVLDSANDLVNSNILLDGLKAYVLSNLTNGGYVGYIYLRDTSDKYLDVLLSIGIPKSMIKKWR